MKLGFALFLVQCAILQKQVSSHGTMTKPTTWLDVPQFLQLDNGTWVHDYAGMKKYLQCKPGLTIPREILCKNNNDCEGYEFPGPICNWYTNETTIKEPTIFDPKLRTFARVPDENKVLHTPWRAPGSAPIYSPCGVSGGNPDGCGAPKCGQKFGGYGHGLRAEEVEFVHPIYVTNWTRGDIVEVAWSIYANHGGGYSYRLCRMPSVEDGGRKALKEECFQQNPLRFVGDKQWIQWGEDESTRLEIESVRTDEGTTPAGSQWTKNPIPACVGQIGGFLDPHPCILGTQFPEPGPGLSGFGINIFGKKVFPFSIVDKVEIPEDLESGEYVLSFRWDTEQGKQVWNSCSSVYVY